MPQLIEKSLCTGCTACASVCPKTAISMQPDGLGFKYPIINPNLCIECKLCEKACPIIKSSYKEVSNVGQLQTLAGQLKDKRQLMESQSGGAFFAIASEFLKNGGLIYGAAITPDFTVKHIKVDALAQLIKLTKSKYVQSDLDTIYIDIVRNLKEGKKVLFSGTPCQVAGLKKVVSPKFIENLFCIDLICHGVPAPAIYKGYLEYLERRFDKKIKEFIFRDKRGFGWETSRERIIFENGTKQSLYYYNFLFQAKNLILRKACSQCRFCTTQRVGDVTIADCWGWDKIQNINLDSNQGVSLLLVNSQKGEQLIQLCKNKMAMTEVPLAQVMQPNLSHPTQWPDLAEKVQRDFISHGFKYIHHKYGYRKINLVKYKIWRYRKALCRRLNKLFRR